ncbi:MAG: hypothetical protein AB7V56_14495 [Candidatus Nitrosocosmicus sp.]|nr:hypothetical protein [Candidatus Nitrosocosmicus sp.]
MKLTTYGKDAKGTTITANVMFDTAYEIKKANRVVITYLCFQTTRLIILNEGVNIE